MVEIEFTQADNRVELTVEIISAYVSNNHLQPSEIAALIASVHTALTGLGNEAAAEPAGPQKATPAQIKKSISHDGLISFEDGKSYKTLRRHLTLRGLSPEAYREKWGLSSDYPMTSANYSAQRSELARALGLGQQRRKPAAKAVPADAEAPEPSEAEEAPKARGRKKATETA